MGWQEVLSLVGAVFASTGLWSFLQRVYDAKKKKLSNSERISLGVAHDRILFLGKEYIKRGYITVDEFKNLHDFLYIPYQNMGGNGAAKKIMDEVERLPLEESNER